MENIETKKKNILKNVKKYKEWKQTLKDINEEMINLKTEIIDGLEELGLKSLRDEEHEVYFSQPKTFDYGLLRYAYPELGKQFVKDKTITTTTSYIDDKDIEFIKAHHPKAYEECMVLLTKRLTVK